MGLLASIESRSRRPASLNVGHPDACLWVDELTASGERVLAGYLKGPMAYVTTKIFRDATAAASSVQPS